MAEGSEIKPWRNKRSSIFRGNSNKPLRGNFLLIDYFTHFDEITTKKFRKLKKGIKSLKFLLAGSHMFNPTYILGLFLLGTSIAIIGFLLDLSITTLQQIRFIIASTDYYVVNLIL